MKKKYVGVALFFLLLINKSFAQQYAVSLLPDSLLKNADAVKRFEELRVVIKSPSKAIIKHSYAITVLNEAGNGHAHYVNSYSKLESLSDISGYLYDATGKELKRVKQKDISDLSYDDDMSLMTDDRLKRHDFYYRQYPYTVYYEDEQVLDGIFFLPYWRPVESTNFSVEKSSFVVETPAGYNLRYKQFNYDKPVVNKTQSQEVFTWGCSKIKALVPEPYQPSLSEVTPTVYIAPTSFQIGNYAGTMDTWQNMGLFIASLIKDRDVLPDNIKADVHRIAGAQPDKRGKIKALYEYMQHNTRYISIQMGIGGWQPFEASYVATKKYGDCKALSNYMKSILKEAGIPANYVLINSGQNKNDLWEDFPSPYFNHAILCVPNEKDTIWLECTNQTISAGFMGSSTCNKKALLIDSDGGHIVRTTFYKPEDNLQLRKVNATLDEKGNLLAHVLTTFTGTQQELPHSLMHNASAEQREKYLNSELNLPTYNVGKNEYKEAAGFKPSVNETLEITSQNYAAITGKRLFIQPNLFNKGGNQLDRDKERKYSIVYNHSFIDADTINIVIPEGYSTESMPKNVTIDNKFGKYNITFSIDKNNIHVLRVYQRYAAIYPPDSYTDFVAFNEAVYKADRSRMVFVKKE